MENSYKALENKMVRYQDLIKVKIKENNEQFVYLDKDVVPNDYLPKMQDMKKIFGDQILVRFSILEKLKKAQAELKKINNNFSLFATYGYRTLEIQTKRFLKRLKKISNIFFQDPFDLYESVHRSTAVPTVAGHPTGGAVDIIILDLKTNKFLDFGTQIYNYLTKDYYVFSPYISAKAKQNRMLLRNLMLGVGFAPFDGEWWHFSYGDREWAFYYKKEFAIYNQINFKNINLTPRQIH